MTVVVGITEENELDKKVALMLHRAYQQLTRRVWIQDTTQKGVVHYCEVQATGETVTLATHGKLSRFWHPKVKRALDACAREVLVEADSMALGFATSTTPPAAWLSYGEVGSGLSVLLIAH